jgi:hypothetical protein
MAKNSPWLLPYCIVFLMYLTEDSTEYVRRATLKWLLHLTNPDVYLPDSWLVSCNLTYR